MALIKISNYYYYVKMIVFVKLYSVYYSKTVQKYQKKKMTVKTLSSARHKLSNANKY